MWVRFTKDGKKKKSSTKLVRINRFLDLVGIKKMASWYLWERNGKIITCEVGCLKLRMRQYRGKTPQNSRTEKL